MSMSVCDLRQCHLHVNTTACQVMGAGPAGPNSRCPRADHWNGQPGFAASSENGAPCGSTYSTSRTSGVSPRLRPMCT